MLPPRMRPILVELPSKLLFALALAAALAVFVRGRWRRVRTSAPLYLLSAARVLMGIRGGGFVPSAATLGPWAPIPIYSYGAMLGSSMVVGWFLTMRLAKQDGVKQDAAAGIYVWTAVWSIIGARLLYVVVQRDAFTSAADMLMVQRGGLVAYGGMIGGVAASAWCCWRRGVSLLHWADVAAPAVVLGTGITRVGCLLFGCDFGRRTDLPWAITFPARSPAWLKHAESFGLPLSAPRSFPVHPTQLYEAAAGFALLALLMLLRRRRAFSGQVFLAWVIGYGAVRPVIEIFRNDDQRGTVGALSTSQFIGLASVLLGAGLLATLWRKHRADPTALRHWEAGATRQPP